MTHPEGAKMGTKLVQKNSVYECKRNVTRLEKKI